LNLLIKRHPELAKDLARIGTTSTSVHIRYTSDPSGLKSLGMIPGLEIVKTVA
jgi:hypothetical protein